VVSDLGSNALSPEEPVCVITRITFPSWLPVPRAIFRFWRLRRLGRREVPGLVDSHIRIRGDATVLFFSLWEDELALIQFTTLTAHVRAVRWMIDKRGRVWSGVFRLVGTSSMSKPWIGTIRHWEPLAGIDDRAVPR
jgi:hypothetical protein